MAFPTEYGAHTVLAVRAKRAKGSRPGMHHYAVDLRSPLGRRSLVCLPAYGIVDAIRKAIDACEAS